MSALPKREFLNRFSRDFVLRSLPLHSPVLGDVPPFNLLFPKVPNDFKALNNVRTGKKGEISSLGVRFSSPFFKASVLEKVVSSFPQYRKILTGYSSCKKTRGQSGELLTKKKKYYNFGAKSSCSDVFQK